MPKRRVHRRPDRDDQRVEQRADSGGGGNATAVAERVPVQRLQMAMQHPRQARPGDLLALQRVGGNQAMLQRLADNGQQQVVVQRTLDEDIAGGLAGGGGAVEPLSGVTMLGSDMAQGLGQTGGFANWNNPNADPVSGAAQGGIAGSGVGGVMQIVGLGLSSKETHEARKDLKEARQQGKKTKEREAGRRLKSSGADVGTRAYGVGSGAVDITARGVGIASQANTALTTTANTLGAVGAGVAIPLSAFSAGRDLRKAIKAGNRLKEIEATIAKWETDAKGATKVVEQLTEREKTASELVTDLNLQMTKADEDLKKLAAALPKIKALPPGDARKAKFVELVKEAKDFKASVTKELAEATQKQKDAKNELDQAVATKAAIDSALKATEKAGHRGDVTLEMIAAYAAKKNRRGVVKKVTSFLGGALGLGAGIAGLVASIAIATGAAAGAAALMATPVGWGLAAAAAAVGIGLGLYKAIRFFSKRWKETEHLKDSSGQALSKGARLKKTFAFWRKVGKGKREHYAESLWNMANKGNAQAKELVKSLGLDWDNMNMGSEKDDSIKLIAAKLAS